MRQLLDLAREHAALRQELHRLAREMTAIERLLTGRPPCESERGVPRMVHVVPDGEPGRYIGVDRDGVVWRGVSKRRADRGEEYIQWRRLRAEIAGDR